MHLPRRTILTAALVLLSVPSVRAQSAADPTGHWEGAIQVPGMELIVEVDLAKNGKGDLMGTISIAAQQLKGLPLLKVAVEGRSLSFHARTDQPFSTTLSADGRSMSGELTMRGNSIPVSMTRTGDPRIEAPARSAPISKELEGTWNGTLDAKGTQLRLVLTMSNQPDGTAIGSVVNLDQGGLHIPVVVTHERGNLALDLKIVGGSYSAALNAEGTELVGTYTTAQGVALPLTFRHAAAEGKK